MGRSRDNSKRRQLMNRVFAYSVLFSCQTWKSRPLSPRLLRLLSYSRGRSRKERRKEMWRTNKQTWSKKKKAVSDSATKRNLEVLFLKKKATTPLVEKSSRGPEGGKKRVSWEELSKRKCESLIEELSFDFPPPSHSSFLCSLECFVITLLSRVPTKLFCYDLVCLFVCWREICFVVMTSREFP